MNWLAVGVCWLFGIAALIGAVVLLGGFLLMLILAIVSGVFG